MDDTTANCLVNLLYCQLVCSNSFGLLTCLNRCKELLDRGAELTLENLILKRLGSDNLNTLLIFGKTFTPFLYSSVILEYVHLRGDVRILSYSSVLYHSFFPFARGFCKKIQVFSQ